MKLLMVILVHGGIVASLPTTPVKYTLYSGYKTWNEVYAICQARDQDMLTLDTLAKYNNFKEIAAGWKNNSLLTRDYWTGLQQSQPNHNVSNLRWSTDCQTLGWVRWGPTEPDHLDIHRCVRLLVSEAADFMTRSCSTRYQIVCEEYTGNCTFEMFESNRTSGLTILWKMRGMTTQECMDACRNYSSDSMECVAFHEVTSTTSCYFWGRETAFVKSNPSMQADSGTNTYVKRCIEGVYVPTTPNVAPNDNMVPVISCNSSNDEASSVFLSSSTQTDPLSASPAATPSSDSIIRTTSTQEMTSPLMPSVTVTVDSSSFQTSFESVLELTSSLLSSVQATDNSNISGIEITSSLLNSIPETFPALQSMYVSMTQMTSPLLSSVQATDNSNTSGIQMTSALMKSVPETVPALQSVYASVTEMTLSLLPSVEATGGSSFQSTYAYGLEMTSPLMSSVDAKVGTLVIDTSSTLSERSMGTGSSSKSSAKTESPYPSQASKTSHNQRQVSSSIPDGIMSTLNLTPTKSIFNECPCSCVNRQPFDLDDLNLAIDRKKVSAYRRSKTSATDDRPSAMAIGKTGIAILAFVFVFIFSMDLDRVVVFVHRLFKKRSIDRV